MALMIVRLVSALPFFFNGPPSHAREEGELARGVVRERRVGEPARLRAPGLGKIEEILSVWFKYDMK